MGGRSDLANAGNMSRLVPIYIVLGGLGVAFFAMVASNYFRVEPQGVGPEDCARAADILAVDSTSKVARQISFECDAKGIK